MLPKLNQSGQLYGTARRSVRYLYLHSAQVIIDYLKPLCSDNEYIIRNTQKFQKLLHQQDLLLPNEEYVSYDAKSLFTNLPHLRNN